ncbi:methyltransferase domain-containing protein [Stigmatella sp. ncwal1]|uniref:Methyltransferase domain-containing protein n=1 Tax=Stigmatella ashevillensis TaxID=2995309 RepID=A0ABT5DI65_9BACT|nr:methyltransferase domain-containing protein [Stigmatella ashevillena]MDC0712051.1 methyltransferase domain-containing protein [Stigmatella ashevillena]
MNVNPALKLISSSPAVREPSGDVVSYYDAKTESILRRYGPGPRVHYHTGLVDDMPPPGMTEQALRVRIHDAQEVLLREMSYAVGESWAGKRVMDVGCGLGGSSLYWATEHRAQMTAVTIAPSHVPWIQRFAAQVGASDRVRVLLCDALEVPGRDYFDRVVAVESSCYLPRQAWFHQVHRLLRPGGTLLLVDCFLGRPELAAPFNRYWHTRLGTTDEYLRAASLAGLELELYQDLAYRTVNFWTLTMDLLAREQEAQPSRGSRVTPRSVSQREHLRLQQGLLDGGLQYAMMVMRRRR